MRTPRIMHLDGDSFFASCEIALDKKLKGKPVFVGGGRRGDGIVIAANYIAKKYGISTGMACFEAKRKCPDGVLCKPHYDEYRRLSIELFKRARRFTPLLVPTSIDEGFLDFTDSPRVFRCKDSAELTSKMKKEISGEIGIPVTCGVASSRWLAKLATDSSKPDGFCEVPADKEKEFLADIPVEKLSGIGKRRARSLRALGAFTFSDLTELPLGLLEKRYGFLGLELWLLANGKLRETLKLENKQRTCIGSSTTLPYDEPDYEAALLFLLDQTDRVLTTLLRENLKAWEMSVFVRFNDFNGDGTAVKFGAAVHEMKDIAPIVEREFRKLVCYATLPIRQVCIQFWHLEQLNMEPDLFGHNRDVMRSNLQNALVEIEGKYGRGRVKSGIRLLLEQQAPHLVGDKPKCPFIPQREMEIKLSVVPEEVAELLYEEDWQPLTSESNEPLSLPRAWGRSSTRSEKFGGY